MARDRKPDVGQVRIVQHFQRAARVDQDLNAHTLQTLFGTESALRTFQAMEKRYPAECAFIWTGTYGTGKSTMAIQLGGLLNPDTQLRNLAKQRYDGRNLRSFFKAFDVEGDKKGGWKLLAIQGEQTSPSEKLRDAFEKSFPQRASKAHKSDDSLIQSVLKTAKDRRNPRCGILIVFDEMGKFLEHGTRNPADIYFFQQLAEACARSQGRLIVLGILHMSFQMYANRLGEKARSEWMKVQGRFTDIPISVSPDEQIAMIAEAIDCQDDRIPESIWEACNVVAGQLDGGKHLEGLLAGCWPLHPATACLLANLARATFAQNQRSVFSFLNSAEPLAFMDFLKKNETGTTYTPEFLWDYLKTNLQGPIAMSHEGHKWSLVEECIARAARLDDQGQAERVMKTIGVMYMLGGGLKASKALLGACQLGMPQTALTKALAQLAKHSVIVFRRYLDSYYPFEGTDFDIEAARKEALSEQAMLDGGQLANGLGIGPVLARRHGIRSGASRYLEIMFATPKDSPENIMRNAGEVLSRHSRSSLCGMILLDLTSDELPGAIPVELEEKLGFKPIIHRPGNAEQVAAAVADLAAYQFISKRPELQGDKIARAEVAKRMDYSATKLRSVVSKAFKDVRLGDGESVSNMLELGRLASDLAENLFPNTPLLRNELINRAKIAGAAAAALRKLMVAMLIHSSEEKLGIRGFPAEMGLYLSILAKSGLHRNVKGDWGFSLPREEDPLRFGKAWNVALDLLRERATERVPVRDLVDLLSAPPFGLYRSPSLLLIWALLLAHRENISVYQSGAYRPTLDESDIDMLLLEQGDVAFTWIEADKESEKYLQELARSISWNENAPAHGTPLAIARALVDRILTLPEWTLRTNRINGDARQLRDTLKRANDPNKVLFSDLPSILGGGKAASKMPSAIATALALSIEELEGAYPTMLLEIEEVMLKSIGGLKSPDQLAERAEGVGSSTGNYRMDAFIQRLKDYRKGDIPSIEAIASLAAGKPVSHWVDRDIDHTKLELGQMAHHFAKIEVFAKAGKGGPKSMSFGLLTTAAGETRVQYNEISVLNSQVRHLRKRAEMLVKQLEKDNDDREARLAIIALAGSKLAEDGSEPNKQ